MGSRIWICDSDKARLAKLKDAFQNFEAATFVHVDKESEVLYLPGLDTVYLSPPHAERWGAKPIFYRAEILKTTAEDQARGMLPYIVSGVMMKPDDRRKPWSQVQLLVECVLEAVLSFNRQNPDSIRNIGFLGRNIAFDPLQPDEVARIVTRAYQAKLLAA